MRAVAAQGRTVDSLRVAVLAALNLADELSQAQGEQPRCAADSRARRQPAAGCWTKCSKKSGRPARRLAPFRAQPSQKRRGKNVSRRAHAAQDL
jgi:cell division protein ZapA (FtsZ GTPase activity inhibitor)